MRAGVIPRLAAMLTSGAEAKNGVQNAAGALSRICAAREGRDASVAAGVPAALTTAMATCNAEARSNAALALYNMCVEWGCVAVAYGGVLSRVCVHRCEDVALVRCPLHLLRRVRGVS